MILIDRYLFFAATKRASHSIVIHLKSAIRALPNSRECFGIFRFSSQEITVNAIYIS